MKQEELKKVLELHKKWLNHEPDGVRAILNGCDLNGADLQGVNLSRANLLRANLHGADLRGAYLGGCNLYEADLSCTDMQGAIFRNANFTGANLRESNLRGSDMFLANLKRANLQKATLAEADLFEANLKRANLRESDLREANLVGADLRAADLRKAKNVPFIPYACPEKGEFVAFKKCGEYIIELLIPADAKRCSGTTRECRASYAKVLSITTILGKPAKTTSVINTNYSPNVVYKVGELVYPDAFDEDRWNEFSHGIHFFINRQEAVES